MIDSNKEIELGIKENNTLFYFLLVIGVIIFFLV
jgi:hypothetical protein